MKKIWLTVVVFAGWVFLPAAYAQNPISSGTISGQVTDQSGATVAGVTVALTNVATNVQQSATTNTEGLYRFLFLSVGNYSLKFSHPGFQITEVRDVVVQVGQTTSVNATLQVGAVTQSVEVTAEAPLLRPTDSSVSTVVNQTLVEELPLSGRRYTDFVLLTPNVTADGQFGLVSIGGQQGGADSGYANGNGSESFTLDGANSNSNYFGDARGRTRIPYVFGEQSIQEFQVADNPYSAAYGAAAGFVNTVTKSGTDDWHGGAFYYNRNSGVGNANDAIDKANGRARPLDVLQQFGADLGAPIVRNKAWFYFDYEQQRRKQPISVINTGYAAVSDPNQLMANFGIPNGTPLPAPNAPYPVPAGFDSPPGPCDPNFSAYVQQVANTIHLFQSNLGLRARRADDLSFFPKVDWQPSTADHVTVVYNYNRFNSPGGTFTFNPVGSFGDQALPNNFVRDHHSTVHWTHNFGPNWLNDLHVSYLRDEQISTPSGLTNPTIPAINNFSRGFFELGNPTFAVGDTKEFQWEITEQLTHVIGRHTLNFGFDWNRTHVTDFFPGNFLGTYGFNSLSDFALGKYGSFSQTTGNPAFPFTFPYYGFYVQDKFQATSKLTLDFGLREDFQVFPQPRPNTTTGFPLVAKLTGQFPNQYQRLSPRFGFAYQPFSKTVVRGGFGIFREIFDGINYETSTIANGLASRQATTFVGCNPRHPCPVPNMRTPTFPNILTNTSSFSASSNLAIVDPGFQIPYILEGSLEIQREVLPNTTVTVGTLWSHGVHLIASTARDLNLIPVNGTTTFTVCPGGFNAGPPEGCIGAPGQVFTRPTLDSALVGCEGQLIPGYPGQINALISPGINNYNSLYVQIQRRAARGLSLMVSYTFSKGLQSSGVDFNNQFDFSDTRGPTLLDQRHRVSVAAVYAPNAANLSIPWARHLLSDWTISTLMAFNSGRPYTAILDPGPPPGCDTLNDSAINQSTGNTAAGIAGSGPSPTQGFNAFYGPWINEIDLGLSRAFRITERHRVTLTAQVFNLFNHPNFYVQYASGIFAGQWLPQGATCGDGKSANQNCFLMADPAFKTLQSINQLNGPRTFQFAFRYQF